MDAEQRRRQKLVDQLTKAVGDQNIYGLLDATNQFVNPFDNTPPEKLIGVKYHPEIRDAEVGRINPVALTSALAKLEELRQEWPHYIGENLNKIVFEPNNERMQASVRGSYSNGRFNLNLTPQALEQAYDANPYYFGPTAFLPPRQTMAHELGHGVMYGLANAAMGNEPRLDLSLDDSMEAMERAKAFFDRVPSIPVRDMPFLKSLLDPVWQETLPTPYASDGFFNTLTAMEGYTNDTGVQMPSVHQLQEPFAESFALENALRDQVLSHAVGEGVAEQLTAPIRRVSPFYRHVEDSLPQLKEFGGVAPNLALGVAGVAGIPLARALLPRPLHRMYDAAVIGGGIGGVPGALVGAGAGLASQLLPKLF